MDSSVEDDDVWHDLVNFSQHEVPLDSQEFKGWWSRVQESSSLTVGKALMPYDWHYLMKILEHNDVSQIKHLVLELPHQGDTSKHCGELQDVLSTGCRFKGLQTLRIYSQQIKSTPRAVDSASTSLGNLLVLGELTNLRTLLLPFCDICVILEALYAGQISQLTSFAIANGMSLNQRSISNISQKLDEALKRGLFRKLRHLDLSNGVLDEIVCWRVFIGNLKAGRLPNVTSLRLSHSSLHRLDLADLVWDSGNWFIGLENLVLNGCGITSEQVYSVVKAITTITKAGLALQRIDLSENYLEDRSVGALISLSNSGRLSQLQELDLSMNRGMKPTSLVNLMETIRSGHLPKLKKLDWTYNSSYTAGAEAIARAYVENEAFTADILIDWQGVSDVSLEQKVKEYRNRNIRLVALKERLGQELGELKEGVPLKCAKVFLCGYPEVGKTKLRKSLRKYFGRRTRLLWETHPNVFKEPRTKGIELSRVKQQKENGDNIELVLWDLAGQHEYHVLHGTFLADLGFAAGKATTFILVFKAPFEIDVTEDKVLYWLKFVASSSQKQVKRHVVVVLNCFNGRQCTETDRRFWMALIKEFAEMFNDLLYICPDPFIIDVRVAAAVQPLKDHLFYQARTLLQDVKVPEVCFKLLETIKGWSQGEKRSHLPILSWQAFEETCRLRHDEDFHSTKVLKVCASYLHQIGEIIYFGERESTEPNSANFHRSIVVADPEWFCREVVGQLLLPKHMRNRGSSVRVSPDGSISLTVFRAFFEHLLVEGTQSEDIISMLELLGLCYKKGTDEIIVPALIPEDNQRTLEWNGKGFHWVMGRCLVTADKNRSAIPGTLFRRLQVEVALDRNLGGRGDSEYRAGKSYSSFKVGELLVLIQFDEDHSDPNDDRIDILVKNAIRGDPKAVCIAQANCICEVMEKLEKLCVTCCPGLRYDIKVIRPWSATEKTPTMIERELMSLTEVKDLVVKGRKYTSWQLRGHLVELRSMLSDNELEQVLGTAEREYEKCKRDAVILGLLREESLQAIMTREEETDYKALRVDMLRSERIHPGGSSQDLQDRIQQRKGIVRERHDVLVRQIQEQQRFSIQEKEKSVPRYMFLSKKEGRSNIWISLKEAFQKPFELHFLCEAHFDDGFLHEVPGQPGIQFTKAPEWLGKVSPWLRRSLKVAIMVGKTVGNIYLPGVFTVIPDLNYLQDDGDGLAAAIDNISAMLLEDDEGVNQHGNYGTAAEPVDLKERLIAQEVVKDLMWEMSNTEFAKKIGLRKVLLRAATVQPHVGCSRQAPSLVLWICWDCCQEYGDRVTDITPRR